jgi:hypothetical protein
MVSMPSRSRRPFTNRHAILDLTGRCRFVEPVDVGAGKVEIGFEVPDLRTFHDEMSAKGVRFPMALKQQEYGGVLARFEDSEGASVTVNGK